MVPPIPRHLWCAVEEEAEAEQEAESAPTYQRSSQVIGDGNVM